MSNRYVVEGAQGAYEPGSDGKVLKNKLTILDVAEMDEVELFLLEKLYQAVLVESLPDRVLTVADLKYWHRLWLGNVYVWAGEERSVNLGKDGFHFAVAGQIARLLDVFERDYLRRFTPCHGFSEIQLIEAIAITHVELILIHPFREGNGRLSRLLADVMAVQSGVGLLDYSEWERQKTKYFAAIQAGLGGDYEPMKHWVKVALLKADA